MLTKEQILSAVANGAEDTPEPTGIFRIRCPICGSKVIFEEWKWGCEGYDIYLCTSCSYKHALYFWDC